MELYPSIRGSEVGRFPAATAEFSLPVTRPGLVISLTTAMVVWIAQILTGTQVAIATLFSIAILFGLLSVFAAGGLRYAFGCLNAILVGKFLLIGVVVKTLLFLPADDTLQSPVSTATVMALGFAGLFLGTWTQSRIAAPTRWSLNRPVSNHLFLCFAIAVFGLSYLGYFAGMLPSTQGQGFQTGGWLGYARSLGTLKSFAIVAPMLYLWRIKTRLWMTHPVILALLAWSAAVGIFGTGKQEAVEPLVCYVLVGFLRYGVKDMRLWSLVGAGVLYYAVIVFPYSQYVRFAGGRDGTFAERAEVVTDTFWRIMSNGEFRTSVSEKVSKASYFPAGPLATLNRLAMVGEADRLIAATNQQQAFTGWETITWGFKLVTPSVLYPQKPTSEAGNYLGRLVGDISPTDYQTQVSYGIMANLYNAFWYPGVLIGSTLFFAGFYYFMRIFLGNPCWDGTPSTSTLWFVWVVMSHQHDMVESSLSGVIASMAFPAVLFIVYFLAKSLSLVIPEQVSPA